MSHYMTALAMKQTGLKPATKIVLYWLADHHNSETGMCFPSLKTLADECEMDVATIKRHLKQLEEIGLIQRYQRHRENGSQTSTQYSLSLQNNLAQNAPPPSAKCATPLAQNDTPHNLVSFNLGTEQEIYTKKGEKKCEALEVFNIISAWASEEAASSFIAYRKKIKKALTVTAAKRLANNLEQILNAGGNTDDALGLAEERGWQTIKPEWYLNDKQSNGRGRTARSGMADAFAAVAARIAAEQGGR